MQPTTAISVTQSVNACENVRTKSSENRNREPREMDIIEFRNVPKIVTERVESVNYVADSLNSLGQPENIYDRLRRQMVIWKGDVVYVFE